MPFQYGFDILSVPRYGAFFMMYWQGKTSPEAKRSVLRSKSVSSRRSKKLQKLDSILS